MNRFLKIGIISLVIIILFFWWWQYDKCSKKGKALGLSFRCSPFSSDPVVLRAIDQYYEIREDKCYRFTDYGTKMNIREVRMEYCQ